LIALDVTVPSEPPYLWITIMLVLNDFVIREVAPKDERQEEGA
jgi:hypothetical protein